MTSVADFLSAGSARDKVVTAAEAIQLIRDGDTVAIEGFGGQCFPEELTWKRGSCPPGRRGTSASSSPSRKATAEDGAWTGSATKGCSAAPSAGTGA